MPPLARADALVLDLDTRAGLCITRSLARSGAVVSVGSRDGAASGLKTRYAARQVVLDDPETDFDAYVSGILAALEEHPADATIPSIDSSVEALHRHRAAFGQVTAPAVGAADAVEIALSKERTLEVAHGLGIPAPRTVEATTGVEIDSAAAEIGFPCVLKPNSSWRPIGVGGERVAPLYLADAAAAANAHDFVRPGAPVLVQELAGGGRETIKLFRAGGRTLVRLAMSIDRAWPPLGGSSVMRRTIAPPEDVLDSAERLVAEIGLEGYAEVEFRRDVRGRPLLMEVNPRLSQSVEVATRAGIDFPRMQLEWARGGTIPAPPAPVLGLRVGWLAGDLRLVLGALRPSPPPRPRLGPTISAVASDYLLHRARLEGFDRTDLKPTLAACAFAVRGLVHGSGR